MVIRRQLSPEIRSSNNIVNTNLQAENGWNYETGFRLRQNNNRFWIDASVFYYQLQDAIARRSDANGNEFFVNAGGTKQLGFESSVSGWLLEPRKNGVIRGVQLRNSYALSKFTFSNYQNASNDYSGKRLTGVPRHVVVSNLSMDLAANVYLFVQHNYTARIPLNDLNTVFSNDYNLFQLKAGWRSGNFRKRNLEIYAEADNLLNERYSLGNDLNAIGGRYFNPAPLRSFFAGMKVSF